MGLSHVHIALGGNLGDVKQTFIQARNELNAAAEIRLLESSKLYKTPPAGPAGQPDYLNAVVEVETSFKPGTLLALLHRIEDAHGRMRTERWGARTLDLDILTYGDVQLTSEALTIPHAMISKRMFVLRPLCDIAPKWQHPLLKVTAEQMLDQLLREGEPPLPEGEVW
ncbi:MAG: 2-amino-4-hydroxy-6-hydroxymethyldihydropteridine diphosphokinase [Mariprofundaceae bacterium]|nr:2-amino-4-hydroxy-6-hydroxymethyldihydropteridine diphosphokinase [Mariprofundaceae bacterium]